MWAQFIHIIIYVHNSAMETFKAGSSKYQLGINPLPHHPLLTLGIQTESLSMKPNRGTIYV